MKVSKQLCSVSGALYMVGSMILLLVSVGCPPDLHGQSYTNLHEFTTGPSDGTIPFGSLSMDLNSKLYGMTTGGGANGLGVVFSINPDGTGYNLLHQFAGGAGDGAHGPGSLLQFGSSIIGMTSGGGSNADGVIFTMKTDGTGFNLLHTFAGGVGDGAGPLGSLTAYGGLFGMTQGGGSAGKGTIFKLGFDGANFQLLHSFLGGAADGALPWDSLTAPSSGTKLFGMTPHGGTQDKGVVFSIGSDGSGFTVLHSFAGGVADGEIPLGSLTAGDKLYGMTSAGGEFGNGVLFGINFDGSGYTVLYSFGAGSSGGQPEGSLTLDGTTLYGMTYVGGRPGNAGTVFRVNTDGTGYTPLHAFSNAAGDGGFPKGSLSQVGGTFSGAKLFGMTSSGGASGFANGVVFRLEVPAELRITSVSLMSSNGTYEICLTWPVIPGSIDSLLREKPSVTPPFSTNDVLWDTLFTVTNVAVTNINYWDAVNNTNGFYRVIRKTF